MKKNIILLIAFIAMGLSLSCGNKGDKENNTLSKKQEQEGWKLLFDGETLNGWHGYNGGMLSAWSVENDVIVCGGSNADKSDRRVDLTTDKKYRNFEFSIDWKISPGSNSGIVYLVDESHPAPWMTGPEYQIIDDEGFPEKLEDWQKTGANYAMNVTISRPTKPVGEWNNTVIIKKDAHVEHWLNGVKVVEYTLWTPEWEKEKAEGKWKDYPTYGTVQEGYISLQDHGSPVYFRNVMIKEL
ncbi:MAG: DUF1080 domain-containing protein [Prevotellaceae bacterium]|jgi:hypothetical protein|nr:DUF1080 domain-containing protein [Prevotellaceae bacterium]